MGQQTAPNKFPTGGDYVDALQHPQLAFSDEQLRHGTLKLDPLGLPEPVSGNFASVFAVEGIDGRRWAVKCFVRPDPSRHRRYEAIAATLQALKHPALVGFEYQPEGIMVAGIRYPILKMRWVEAQSLISWLEINRTDPKKLNAVADQFVNIVEALEKSDIAHGDLQHGNLLITPTGDLKLIDYDGMYVPRLQGLPPNENGLANYQHPGRSDRDYGPGLDRFSAWVIYASLIALAARPELWEILRAEDDDTKLLFDAADYRNPHLSNAFAELRVGGPNNLVLLADKLSAFAQIDPARVQPLTALAANGVATPSGEQSASSSDLPDWLIDHLPPSAMQKPPVQARAPGHRHRFAGRHLRASRAALIALLISLAAIVATVLGSRLLTGVPIIVWVVTGLLSVATISGAYRKHPLLGARFQAEITLVKAQREAEEAQNVVDEIQRQFGQLNDEKAEKLRNLKSRSVAVAQQRDASMAQAQATLRAALSDLQRQRNLPGSSQKAREAKRLTEIVAEHVEHKISKAVIIENPPAHIDSKVAHNLAQHGFRTAADFVGFRIVGGGPGRGSAVFLCRSPGDSGIHVDLIDETHAKALTQWREKYKKLAENSAPASITPLDRQNIAAAVEKSDRQILANEGKAMQVAREANETAKSSELKAQLALKQEERRIDNEIDSRRRNIERRIAGARRTLAIANQKARKCGEVSEIYSTVTRSRFLLATLGI